MKLKLIILSLIFCINACSSITYAAGYLTKPTGQYNVAFEDFHWVNDKLCPDPFFNENNKDDFSQKNTKYCHEIIARIYYPTTQYKHYSLYNLSFIKLKQQEILNEIPTISKYQLEQLNNIESYSIKKADIVNEKKFPVLLFLPGGNFSFELYENFITDLVSHGYIVIGINTPFVNLVTLPNGHIVKTGDTKDTADIEKKSVPLQAQDLMYVFKKIHELHHSNALFSAMDLKHIGVFGHSIGARALADVTHAHPTWFQAGASLDIGFDLTGLSRKKFYIPFMNGISANRKTETARAINFELGSNGYLVVFSPSEKNNDYSHHVNFSDLSTLQYLPAMQALDKYSKQKATAQFDLKFMTHDPKKQESDNFKRSTYVLIKNNGQWDIMYFEVIKNLHKHWFRFIGGTSGVKGLDTALAFLPNKKLELLSTSDIKPIKNVIMTFQRNAVGQPFGTANGWVLTHSINTYLLQFFDKFLKNDQNLKFKKCVALTKDTVMKCGPGNF